MTLQLLDTLLKAQKSPTTRTIRQETSLGVRVPGSENGYLQGAIYQNNFPQVVRWDGLAGNLNDPKDGVIWFPLAHYINGHPMPLPKGTYIVKVEAADAMTAVPTFWNIDFDIV